MTLLSLVGALYFMVSGGPYGLEELVQKVGFGASVAILAVTPVVWSVPTALMVGELSAALPEEGGYYAWVRRALGPFWGFQEAWLSLVASVFDMAIYPTLFVLYLGKLSPALGEHPMAVGALMIAAGAAYNLAGARSVGLGAAIMTALLLAPFAVLSLLAVLGGGANASVASAASAAHVVTLASGASVASPPAGSDVAGGVLIAMWNYMGWDNASTIAGEVERPQRTYPVAVLTAVALIALVYIVTVGAMALAGVDASAWTTGSWVDAGRAFGGAPLAWALVAGGMVSAFGMFNALCLSYSRLPAVLAEDGYLPAVLSRRLRRTGAPWVSVLVCAGAWTLSLGLPFERLVSLDILLYGTSLVLEFVALLALRVREPALPRPFRVPGGYAGAALVGLAPTALLGFALVKNADEEVLGVSALWFGVALMAAGPALYAVHAARSARTGKAAGERRQDGAAGDFTPPRRVG